MWNGPFGGPPVSGGMQASSANTANSPLSSSLGALGFVGRDDLSLNSLLGNSQPQQQQRGMQGIGALGQQRPSSADDRGSSSLAGNLAFGAPGSAAFSSTGGVSTSAFTDGPGPTHGFASQQALGAPGSMGGGVSLPASESSLFESSILLTPGQRQLSGMQQAGIQAQPGPAHAHGLGGFSAFSSMPQQQLGAIGTPATQPQPQQQHEQQHLQQQQHEQL